MPPNKKDDDFVVSLPQQNEHELESLAAENRATRHDAVPEGGALSQLTNSSSASILGYCLASISMTVVNKYVVSGEGWNLMFLYLAIQVGSPPPPRPELGRTSPTLLGRRKR